jgi:hypothetical protein
LTVLLAIPRLRPIWRADSPKAFIRSVSFIFLIVSLSAGIRVSFSRWNKETPYPEKPAAVCLFYRLSPFRCIPATHSDPGQKVAGFRRNDWPESLGIRNLDILEKKG